MNNISEHITYAEATQSNGHPEFNSINIPSADQFAAMQIVAEKCFEPARAKFGPLIVSSFFRCPGLNKAVGGQPTSQHMKGEAIDMVAGDATKNAELFEWCKLNLVYDQLIWEFGNDTGPAWVHISFTSKGHNRNMHFRL